MAAGPGPARVRVTYGAPRPAPAIAEKRAAPAIAEKRPTPAIAEKRPTPGCGADADSDDDDDSTDSGGSARPRAKRRLVQASLGFARRAGLGRAELPGRGAVAGRADARPAEAARKTQAFLGFGQRPLAAEPCPECGMAFQRGRDDDEALHRRHHRSWQQRQARALVWDGGGAAAGGAHAATAVAYPARLQGGGRGMATIRCVDAQCPSRREIQRALAVLGVANEQLGACALGPADLAQRQRKIFVYISPRGRVEGCVLAEAIAHARRVVAAAAGAPAECAGARVPAACGISRIWVAPHARRCGIASQMVAAVRAMFVYGCRLAPAQLAFSQPTADGRALAERLFGRRDFLVYAEPST